MDYTPAAEVSQQFFATVQNKMHRAAHGQTAAEVIHARVDAVQPFMRLRTTRPGGIIRKEDVSIAKNYLDPVELDTLNRIVKRLPRICGVASTATQGDDLGGLDCEAG